MVKDRTNGRRAAILLPLLVTLVLAALPFVAMAGEPVTGADILRDLVRESLERNPELAAFRSTAEGLEQRVLPAGSLPDPMLSLAFSNVPVDDFRFDKEPMTSRDIGFTQAIPFPGKLSLKQEIARLSAVQGSDRVESMRNLIRFRVKRDFFLLMENREVTRLTEKNKALFGELLAVANSRYSVGKTPQQDLFKAQVEISRLEKMLIALRKKNVELVADLNTLRNRPVTDPVELPVAYDAPEFPHDEAHLLELAKTSNPDLRREEDAVRQKETALALARKQILPDFQIGGAYKVREDPSTGGERPDFFSATVGITLPLWHGRKQDKEVEASVRELSSAKSRYEDAWNAIRNRLKEIAADIAAQRETLSLFDTGLLPQARESVNSSRAAYEVGQVEFASVLLGQIALYQQEIDREKTAETLRIRTSELELVLGKELF
ncbi:MAG: TolC family protein [Deltaproteobacteria bacterium]|nr:MAG: TolC family protein [Deltaproteobacteria bacterium]